MSLIRKILNNIVLYVCNKLYNFYSLFWMDTGRIYLKKTKNYLRRPTEVILPQYDENFKMRSILLRTKRLYYQYYDLFIKLPIINVLMMFTMESNINLIFALPLILVGILNFGYDGRDIKSEKDIEKIVKTYGLDNDLPTITDENCYELNVHFDILKKIDKKGKSFVKTCLKNTNCIKYNGNVNVVLKNLNNYYYQDCWCINDKRSYDIVGLFESYFDENQLKKLKLTTIVIYDKLRDLSYLFVNNDENWTVIRNTYINWSRSNSTNLMHQLGNTSYPASFLYYVKHNLSYNHPLYLLIDSFMSLVYFGSNTILIGDVPKNDYISQVELNDMQNNESLHALRELHKNYGKSMLNYPEILEQNQIDDIYFTQKETLDYMFKIQKKLVTEVFDYYYKSEEDFKNDVELKSLFDGAKEDFSFLEYDKNSMIVLFTNIIFLSTARHVQTHLHRQNLCDYGLIKTNIEIILNELYMNKTKIFEKNFLYSSYSNLYLLYTLLKTGELPIEAFGYEYINLYKDENVTKFFKTMSDDFFKLKNSLKLNHYTKYIAHM